MKAKKLVTTMLVSLLAIVLMITPVLANEAPIDTVEHRYVDSVVFVPLRLTAYAYGATVEWDGPNQTVYVTAPNGHVLTVVVAQVGGFIDNGTVWVPYEYALGVFSVMPAADEPDESPDIHGMITRVSYGDNAAYVFGTAHLGVPEWFPLNPIVEDAMSRADIFVLERNFEAPSAEFMEAVQNLMLLPEGTTLEDVLPQDIFDNLIYNLATFPNVAYEDIAMLTPVAAWGHILQTEILPLMGVDPTYSVDSYIMQYIFANDRPVVGINDFFYETAIFLDIAMDIQVTIFENFADWETTVATFINPDVNFILAYQTADMDLLAAAMIIEFDLETAHGQYLFEKAVVYRGNIFATEIARLLMETEEPTTFFVAVGIGHIMGGDFGQVLVILEDMGFDVVPLWR